MGRRELKNPSRRLSRANINCLAALICLVGFVPLFQNCTKFEASVQNFVVTLPSGNDSNTSPISSSVTETIGSRTVGVKPSDSIVLGQTYEIVIKRSVSASSTPGAQADQPLTWKLQTDPADACTLTASDATSLRQKLKCTVAAQVRLEILDPSNPTAKILISKAAVGPLQLETSGTTIYQNKCASCHGPLATSTVRNKSVAEIALAIVHIPAMVSQSPLQELSSTELHSLSRVLSADVGIPPSPTPTGTPGSIDGAQLYTTKCAGCHQPLASSQKLGRTSVQISAAIENQAVMKSLSVLTAAEVEAIARALQPAAPTEKSLVKRKGRMVSRFYLNDLLTEVFASPTFSIEVPLRPILYKPNTFGTACDVNSSFAGQDCGAVIAGTAADLMMESTTVRELTKLKACEDILNNTAAILNAAAQISALQNSTTPKDVTDALLPDMFGLFFRTRSMTTNEIKGYSTLVKALKSKNPAISSLDLWRAVLLAMCESPEWEVL